MLTITNLVKEYDKVYAVNNVNLKVDGGEITVLLGPNGAGKSTTIKCIAGLLKYNGNIEICKYNNKSIDAKKIFGYVPETPALYEILTVYEHLEFVGHAYDIENYQEKIESLLQRFELLDKRDKLGKELSKGMQQKVCICSALLIEPKVILFDEPMIGLDPKAIKELKEIFIELKQKGCSVMISTHIIDSINGLWDRVLIMKNGEIVLERIREDLEQRNESLEQLFFEVTEG